MEEINDLQAGKAGEYLVCADLIIKGYVAFPSEQGLPYDVVCEIKQRLFKIQVKSSRCSRPLPQRKNSSHTPAYSFRVKYRGKDRKKEYQPGMVDIFAFVALDTKEIAYMAAAKVPQSLQIRSMKRNYTDDKHTEARSIIKGFREQGLSYREISEKTGINASQVHRMHTGKNIARKHKYFCDYLFEDALKFLRDCPQTDRPSARTAGLVQKAGNS